MRIYPPATGANGALSTTFTDTLARSGALDHTRVCDRDRDRARVCARARPHLGPSVPLHGQVAAHEHQHYDHTIDRATCEQTWLGWPSSSGMMVVCVDNKDGTRSLVLSPVPIAALCFYVVHEHLPNGDMPETFGIGCVLLLVSMVASLLLVWLKVSIITFAKAVKIVPKQGSKSSVRWELRLVGGLLKGWPCEGEPAAVSSPRP